MGRLVSGLIPLRYPKGRPGARGAAGAWAFFLQDPWTTLACFGDWAGPKVPTNNTSGAVHFEPTEQNSHEVVRNIRASLR